MILFAVAAKHVVAHPKGHLANVDRWLLLIAILLFIGGQLVMQFRMVRRLAPERVVALTVVGGITAIAATLPGTAVVGLMAGVLATMSLITWRRFRGTELGRALGGR